LIPLEIEPRRKIALVFTKLSSRLSEAAQARLLPAKQAPLKRGLPSRQINYA
jgi:hypothetical protein